MIYFHGLNTEFYKSYSKNYIVTEGKEEYKIEYLLPEVQKEELDIYLRGKYLHIKDVSNKKRVFSEKIDDKILLNKKIDKNNIKAKLKDGVLKLSLKFKENIEETRKIIVE